MKKSLITAAVLGASAMLNAWIVPGAKVFPADSTPTITIRAQTDAEKKLLAEGELYYLSGSATWSDGEYRRGPAPRWEKPKVEKTADTIRVKIKLRGEDNHYFRLAKFGELPYKGPHVRLQGKKIPAFLPGYAQFRFYTLKPDLMGLRPWKGDIHQHSLRCGHAKEPPHRIPAFGRRAGFDYLSLSEHKLHKPSLEAIEANENADAGMRAFPAEEFHTAPAFLHAVAVGHTQGVNEWVAAHPQEFEKRWKEEVGNPEYDAYGMNKFEREMIAKARVMYRIAHNECQAKLVSYCHPADQNPGDLTDDPPKRFRQAMMDLFEYDSMELFNAAQYGGLVRMSLVHAMAMEQIARGRKFGFVSVSDCHRQADHPLYGKFFTVIFAKDCQVDDFADAVKNRMSIAVRTRTTADAKDNKSQYLYYGPARLMCYQQFLDAVYWPYHDKLCREQGELMLKLADGDESVRPEIAKFKKAIEDYRNVFFYTPKK